MKSNYIKAMIVIMALIWGLSYEADGMYFIPPDCYSTKVLAEGGMSECQIEGGCEWIEGYEPAQTDFGRPCTMT